jgi:von Willebrand factor type A domain
MMTESIRSGVWSCAMLALCLGCARVTGVTEPPPDAGLGLGTGSGSGGRGSGGQGSGSGGMSGGGGPLGTGGSQRGTLGSDAGSMDVPVCGLFHAPLEKQPPDVLILLDRSASMTEQVLPPGFDAGMFVTCLLLGNCPMTASKWVTMTGALNSSVMASAATVNYGLKFFPDDAGCGVMDGVAVPIAASNAAAMNSAMAMTAPGGFTPTATALASAGQYLKGLTRPNPRFVLLATDGEPTCGAGGGNMGSDAQASIAAVTNLAAAGIPVYVIGIATQGMADTTLNAMATAGGRPRNGTPAYYPVQTAADLSGALSAIGGQIASCTFTVKPPEPPADPNNVAVKANGMTVPKSTTDGWQFGPSMTSIEITGSWCAQIQAGTITDIQAVFACTDFVIP